MNNNVVCVVAIVCMIANVMMFAYLINSKRKQKISARKEMIDKGKTITDRFDRIERSLKRIECKLGAYRKDLNNHINKHNVDIDKYNENIDKIGKDVSDIFELLNKQPEVKEEEKGDDSTFWGIISGILSGALSSALIKYLGDDSKKESAPIETEENAEQPKGCYVIQNKATGEVLEQRFDSLLDAYKWLMDNGLEFADYNVGMVKTVETTPEEEQPQE